MKKSTNGQIVLTEDLNREREERRAQHRIDAVQWKREGKCVHCGAKLWKDLSCPLMCPDPIGGKIWDAVDLQKTHKGDIIER